MKKTNKSAAPVQASAVENRTIFLTQLRDSLRSVAEQMRFEEVLALCGPSHYPQPGAIYRRAGTEGGHLPRRGPPGSHPAAPCAPARC